MAAPTTVTVLAASTATPATGGCIYSEPPLTQWGPSASWPVVLVPIGGPSSTVPVSTLTLPPLICIGKRSIPRGAGPPFFSPTWLYCEPWHGHSNHFDVSHEGTRHPRWGHFWKRATSPSSSPAWMAVNMVEVYWACAEPMASDGYRVIHM